MRRMTIAKLLIVTALLGSLPVYSDTEVEGTTAGGAHYKIVVPDDWNGDLVIWNHGFSLSPIGPVRDVGPLEELHLLEGYAVAASSYRQVGWAVFKSHQDLELLVSAFSSRFDPPSRVFLYGASLGSLVTAAALERADLGNVVGALMFCGAVGGSRNWDAALDLRLLYDVVCADIPEAAIPGGAAGLPKGSSLTEEEIADRVDACTGILKSPGRRTRAQKRNLRRLVRLSRIPKQFLITDMDYATRGLADLIHSADKLRGKQGVGNADVDYGDPEVDATIARVVPKRKSAKRLRRNYRPKGRVGDTRIITLHTDKDGLVLVENESEYAAVVPPENLTVAIAVERNPSHCGFTPPEILAVWEALRDWADTGQQPSAFDLQATCEEFARVLPGRCRIDPDFRIPDMDERIRPR